MTYKRCGWLAEMCFLGVLLSGGMTENGRIDLFSGAVIMLALLAVGFVAARASMLLCAYEQQKHERYARMRHNRF
jgi:hypothetical protein